MSGEQNLHRGIFSARHYYFRTLSVPGCGSRRYSDYNMTHPRRGLAIIFNHYKYADPRMKNREGTQQDCRALDDVLSTLGFEVRSYDDLTYEKISAVLEEVRLEDHTNADCLFVAVMTHGQPGELAAYDTMYPVKTLWTPFVDDTCPSLAGKPKIFVIQACQGWDVDDGVQVAKKMLAQRLANANIPVYYSLAVVMEVEAQGSGNAILPIYNSMAVAMEMEAQRSGYVILPVFNSTTVDMVTKAPRSGNAILSIYSDVKKPQDSVPFIHPDMLLAYSSPEGFFSWRQNNSGSWFIQSLVHQLWMNGNTRDLVTILTFVNRQVAMDYQTHVPRTPEFDRKKIIPSFTSMLTKLVFFR